MPPTWRSKWHLKTCEIGECFSSMHIQILTIICFHICKSEYNHHRMLIPNNSSMFLYSKLVWTTVLAISSQSKQKSALSPYKLYTQKCSHYHTSCFPVSPTVNDFNIWWSVSIIQHNNSPYDSLLSALHTAQGGCAPVTLIWLCTLKIFSTGSTGPSYPHTLNQLQWNCGLLAGRRPGTLIGLLLDTISLWYLCKGFSCIDSRNITQQKEKKKCIISGFKPVTRHYLNQW